MRSVVTFARPFLFVSVFFLECVVAMRFSCLGEQIRYRGLAVLALAMSLLALRDEFVHHPCSCANIRLKPGDSISQGPPRI